ncbi:hypothetical protein HanRHA438_Chr09g0392151 [Helianthus annuus]|nr:hypothetical protein HanRHA438_Chr09g0392151 [Helianthus annuus]
MFGCFNKLTQTCSKFMWVMLIIGIFKFSNTNEMHIGSFVG